MKLFPYIYVKTEDWFYFILVGLVTSWDQLEKLFDEKYFLDIKQDALRRKIKTTQQYSDEPLDKY